MNTYLVGAGFSAFAKLPMISNMFEQILKYRDNYNDKYDYKNLDNSYQKIYNEKLSVNTRRSFEDYISQVDVLKSFEINVNEKTGFFENGYWSNSLKSSMYIISELFRYNESINNEKQNTFYDTFAKQMRKNDVIITFNWDTIIEKSFLRNKIFFSYKPNEKNKIPLLKLHGSLNWVDVPKNIQPKHKNMFDAIDGRTTLLYSKNYKYIFPKIGLDEFSFIITPTIMKNPLKNVAMRNIWTKAFNSIKNSKNIFIIGCSFSGVDFHAKGLIKSALNKKNKDDIIIINPDNEVKEIYNQIIGDNYTFINEKFDPTQIKSI